MVQRARFLLLPLVVLAASSAFADAPRDLDACQTAVAQSGAKYVDSVVKAVGSCLSGMSKAVVGDGATVQAAATSTAKACVTALRKLENSAKPSSALAAVFESSVDAKCDPVVNPKLQHAAADTYTVGPRTLGAESLAAACGSFGGEGVIGSFGAWRSCLRAAADCQARQAIALQWPRALEHMAALKTALAARPPASDRDDALAALRALDAALEGSVDDDVPETTCGGVPGGTLLVTGQTFCVSPSSATKTSCPTLYPNQDGFWRAGRPFAYTDNGDGTITDDATGLTWEKLGRDGGIHDVGFADTWSSATAVKIAQLNTAAFAGHSDWRVPNRRELDSLLSLSGAQPAVQPAFDDGCAPGCSPLACSCTSAGPYWSSSVYAPDASRRWTVSFGDGSVIAADKSSISAIAGLRAVRGGRTQPPLAPATAMAADVNGQTR